MARFWTTIATPLGPATAVTDAQGALLRFGFGEDPEGEPRDAPEVRRQVDAYFERRLTRFELPLAAIGTPFQQRVWRALEEIGFGETCTYGELARKLGDPKAVRAVGRANGANPIALIVPCHRVIGASGSLVGYAGGLPIKEKLLAFERGSLFDPF